MYVCGKICMQMYVCMYILQVIYSFSSVNLCQEIEKFIDIPIYVAGKCFAKMIINSLLNDWDKILPTDRNAGHFQLMGN